MTEVHTWTIISGGPTRTALRPEDVDSSQPVVSINRGVEVIDQGIRVHFAAFADIPSRCWEPLNLERYATEGLQVWVPLNHLSLWDKALPASCGIRPLPMGVLENELDKTQKYAFTLASAFSRVMAFSPQRVRILCADMIGSWAEGMTESECEEHQSTLRGLERKIGRDRMRYAEIEKTASGESLAAMRRQIKELEKVRDQLQSKPLVPFKRWEHEGRHMKILADGAREKGVEVEFWSPTPVA